MFRIIKRVLCFPIFKFKINYSKLNPFNIDRVGFKKFIKFLANLIILLSAITIINIFWFSDYSGTSDNMASDISEEQEKICNVYGIELHGELVTYMLANDTDSNDNVNNDQTASEDIVITIEQAEQDEKIKAILLEVDSYGGSPVAAEEIMKAMKTATKLTVALVRTAAVSGAYWSATGADIIFASAISDIGGIGVTSSYLDNSKKNIKDGLTFNSLSTGIFKDTQNPDKSLTEAERKLILRDSYIIHDHFVNSVAANRNLDVNKVKALADGSTLLGEAALKNGLIDRIGGMPEVKAYLKEKIGEEPEICW